MSRPKMSKEERDKKLAELRSQAKDLDCLRNEFSQIKPGEKYTLSEGSMRALKRIRKKMERCNED